MPISFAVVYNLVIHKFFIYNTTIANERWEVAKGVRQTGGLAMQKKLASFAQLAVPGGV